MSTTTPVISKHDLLRQIGQSYRALRSAIEALPPERLTEELSTGWSLNENIAHLAAWEETVPKRVAGVLESGEDPKLYDDVDGGSEGSRCFDLGCCVDDASGNADSAAGYGHATSRRPGRPRPHPGRRRE